MSAVHTPAQADAWFDGRVSRICLPSQYSKRGELLPVHLEQLPWTPRRVFTVSNVPAGTCRGGHGHLQGQQLLLCVQGRIAVTVRYEGAQIELELEPGGPGILIQERVWAEQRYLLPHSVLLAFASEDYNPDSYFEAVAGCE